jgi:hypothetical protein
LYLKERCPFDHSRSPMFPHYCSQSPW